MNDIPRQKLREIIAKYGRSICNDRERCKGLLLDYCSEYRMEVHVLTVALEEQIVIDLLNISAHVPQEMLLSHLADKLYENRRIDKEAARWSVESWALALGMTIQTNVPRPPERMPLPPRQPEYPPIAPPPPVYIPQPTYTPLPPRQPEYPPIALPPPVYVPQPTYTPQQIYAPTSVNRPVQGYSNRTPKSAALAGFLEFLFPGAGFWYAISFGRGLLVFVINAAIWGLLLPASTGGSNSGSGILSLVFLIWIIVRIVWVVNATRKRNQAP